uniref:Metalloendopeptidase n=1 Tax=Isarachnanthus nocturnus TaxID=1240238 RepID=A0A7G7WYS1_9CNID|nr:toxin candidate TRINITY_DN17792_c1_g2_i2 [Isarachnanthus nocturnus]
MATLKVCFVLCCIFVLQGETHAREPPRPNRNNFDVAVMKLAENKTYNLGRKEEVNIFAAILRANKHFQKSRLARLAGMSLFEGDIISTPDTDEMKEDERGGRKRPKRALIRDRRLLWPKIGSQYYIPYYITSSNQHASRQILAAMGEWMTKVPCLKFVRRSNQNSYLSFFSGGGCYSMVGMQGGKQALSIGRGCEHHGVIVHEIGHALGFWHEQSRPDRDNYVTIRWQNIQRGMEHNFNKYSTSKINSYGQAYDFGSVMHYGGYAFSSNRQPTIVNKRTGSANGLGQRNGLGPGDVKQANLMYCGGVNPKPTSSPTGCSGDKNNNCRGWAAKGYCTDKRYAEYMRENCCKTCKVPKPITAAPTTVPPTTVPACVDKDSECPGWAKKGYCTNAEYQKWMAENCCKSCRNPPTVPPPCIDKHGEKCNRWALDGLCKIGSCFMAKECCLSCKNPPSPDCKDVEDAAQCRQWKNREFCVKGNRWFDFMKKNCAKTCSLC